MKNLKEYILYLLYLLPGLYLVLIGEYDLFAAIAVILISGGVVAFSASTLGVWSELHRREKVDERDADKIKTSRQVAAAIFLATLVLSLVLGGATYLGVALYGAFLPPLVRTLGLTAYTEMTDYVLSD